MFQRRLFLSLSLLCLLAGCQYKVAIMNDPVSVSGKLTKGGQPVGNVTLMLQPLETGHMVPLAVGSDGSYKGTVVPGKYAYYLAPSDSGDASALSGLDAALQEASMTRTLTIEPGQTSLNVEI
jgi:hypothetical protein